MAIPASTIARAIAYAIEQPAEVEIDEAWSGLRHRTSNTRQTSPFYSRWPRLSRFLVWCW